MTPFTLTIILMFSILSWLLVCLFLYRKFSQAAWLAGSSVSSSSFFLGATLIAGIKVPISFLMTPLWLGVGILLFVHLNAAQRANRHTLATQDLIQQDSNHSQNTERESGDKSLI